MNENGRAFQMEHMVRTGRLTVRQIDILAYLLRLLAERIVVDFAFICDTLPEWAIKYLTNDGKTTYNSLKNILKIANDKGIITHLMGVDDGNRIQQHLYTLGPGGQYMLKADHEPFHLLPLLASSTCKLRILNYNAFSVGHPCRLDIAYDHPQDKMFRFFISNADPEANRIVSYYPQKITETEIVKFLRERIKFNISKELPEEEYYEEIEKAFQEYLRHIVYVPIDIMNYKQIYPKTRNKELVPDPEDVADDGEDWRTKNSRY